MNKRTLYLECNSGLSGDMFTAALLDLGADEAVLRKALASLPLDGFDIKISRVKKSGLDACDFDVVLDAAHENHDHDMAYLYGDDHAHCHMHEHHHDHDHTHGNAHDHAHGDHHHHHEHRGLAEILDILSRADLTPRARELAERIFTILGRAEAKAHGATLETVHFHEVGAVDSIVDITAAAVCLDNLGIEEVILPILYEGTGTIRCAHGVLPIPVPAVVNIAAAEHLNLHITTAQGEYVTPTGAAIAAAIRTSETLPVAFTVEKIGLGAGKREQELPGFVRAMLIHPHSAADGDAQDTICKLETNIAACTGEALGYVMERLMGGGSGRVLHAGLHEKEPPRVSFGCALPAGGRRRHGANYFFRDDHHRHPPRKNGALRAETPSAHRADEPGQRAGQGVRGPRQGRRRAHPLLPRVRERAPALPRAGL